MSDYNRPGLVDQVFAPGDKVMVVVWFEPKQPNPNKLPEFEKGKVYCVERCWIEPFSNWHAIDVVGMWSPPDGNGWLAACFRRVEEIKLCIEAVKTSEQPQEANR